MIKLSSCNCCNGYVAACDKCGKEASKCSNATESEAVQFALRKGFITRYPTPTSKAQLLCGNCSAETTIFEEEPETEENK